MGFRAPSADEVYRYALRLDAPRSLTDRFGFSIVFVTDGSPMCREFLQRYGIDLCLRTADRIRFVFFSDLPPETLESTTDGGRRGPLRGAIALFGRRSRFDFEEKPWRSLRPKAFEPLADVAEVRDALESGVEMFTAMPGMGAAMEFAQRLGIGRHVPCMLVFTEIGALHVDLLPMASLTPEEAFSHARRWIDEFYEENRESIGRWGAVEDEIRALVGESHSTLWDIRRWRDERLRAWQHLASVSHAIRALEDGDEAAWTRLAKEARYDSQARGVSKTLDWLSGELAGRDRRRYELAGLEGDIARLEAADGPVAAAEALGRIRRHLPAGRNAARLDEALSRFREVMRPSPTDALKAWWVHIERTTVLSAARYRDMSGAWRALRPAAMTARTERRAVLDAVRALRLDVDPADGAEQVFTALAGVLAADPSSPSWRRDTDGGRLALADFIERARSTAPGWLSSAVPDVTLGEALPIGEDLGKAWRSLDLRQRLQAALTAAETHPDLERELLEWRQSVLADLRAAAAERVAQDDEPRRIRDKALAQLQPLRRRLEDEALEWDTERPKRRKPVGPDLAARLHRALDAYDAAIRAIAFPHTRDPRVIRVPVARRLEEAAGLAGEDRPADGVQRLRQDLDEAVALDAEPDRRRAVEEVSAASPVARLRAALDASLTPERIAALAPDVAGVLRSHRAADLLQRLTRGELEGVASALGVAPEPRAILVTLGLYSGGAAGTTTETARRLAEKSRSDDFDVFLAHNSDDKAAVLEIAERLREAGIHPWVDVEQVPPGEFFQDAIQKVVPRVKAAAVLVGRNGIGRWQALELRSFISQCVERAMPVIPVLLPHVEAIPAETPFLREFNAVQFGRSLNDDAALRGLVWGITGHRPDPKRRAARA